MSLQNLCKDNKTAAPVYFDISKEDIVIVRSYVHRFRLNILTITYVTAELS